MGGGTSTSAKGKTESGARPVGGADERATHQARLLERGLHDAQQIVVPVSVSTRRMDGRLGTKGEETRKRSAKRSEKTQQQIG